MIYELIRHAAPKIKDNFETIFKNVLYFWYFRSYCLAKRLYVLYFAQEITIT